MKILPKINFVKKLKNVVLFSMMLLLMSSCAVSRFTELNKIETISKDCNSIQYCVVKPKRSALCIGLIEVDGDCFSKHETVIKEAKRKAAKLGGDFILEENFGTNTKTVFNPGFSTYQSKGSANIIGNSNFVCGSASENSSGFSVGPSVSTYDLPWGVFSVWVYRKSSYGIDCDDIRIITRFSLKSDAEEAGIKLGDKIIGIDGFDWDEEGLAQHEMNILPGDKVVFNLSRDGKRVDCTITALPN